jgi:hypothetical protein
MRKRVDCSLCLSIILELLILAHYTQLQLKGRVNLNERINEQASE